MKQIDYRHCSDIILNFDATVLGSVRKAIHYSSREFLPLAFFFSDCAAGGTADCSRRLGDGTCERQNSLPGTIGRCENEKS